MTNAVELKGITRQYQHRPVLKDLNLSIPQNIFSVIYGVPACGKSVLLRVLTGLEKPDAGQVLLREEDVTKVGPGERNIGYVPQSFALYPHFKVYDNIAYPLKLMGVSKQEIDPVVQQTAELLQIKPLLQKYPGQLSGGEKQRVAIARGIVKNTEIFVMDDPLTGLDFKLREQLFDDLRNLQEALQATIIYTTSDPLEALMLAEQVNVLDGGQIIETGQLEKVYAHPEQMRTMSLLGFPSATMFPGSLTQQNGVTRCHSALFDFPVKIDTPVTAGQPVMVGIRPQEIRLGGTGNEPGLNRQANIVLTEDLGGELVVYLEAEGLSLVAVVRHDDAYLVSNGHVNISAKPDALVLFAPEQGRRLGQGVN